MRLKPGNKVMTDNGTVGVICKLDADGNITIASLGKVIGPMPPERIVAEINFDDSQKGFTVQSGICTVRS